VVRAISRPALGVGLVEVAELLAEAVAAVLAGVV